VETAANTDRRKIRFVPFLTLFVGMELFHEIPNRGYPVREHGEERVTSL